jgi:hypothetical protein
MTSLPRSVSRAARSRASAFAARPASPTPLAAFRIGLATVLLVQAGFVAGALLELYGRDGVARWSVCERGFAAGVPRLSWLAAAFAPLGLSADAAVRAAFLAYVGGLVGLLVGWRSRAAAATAWLAHLALGTSGSASTYGVDQWATVGLFYCVWMPVGGALSLDRWGRGRAEPTPQARLALRVLQLHLCIAYFASGVEKAAGAQWWNGEAVWRAGMRPDLARLDLAWLATVPWVAVAACWATLAVELGYAVFVWPARARAVWAGATIGLHAGIAVVMGLWTFSALMIVLTASAFLVPAESKHPAGRSDALTGS